MHLVAAPHSAMDSCQEPPQLARPQHRNWAGRRLTWATALGLCVLAAPRLVAPEHRLVSELQLGCGWRGYSAAGGAHRGPAPHPAPGHPCDRARSLLQPCGLPPAASPALPSSHRSGLSLAVSSLRSSSVLGFVLEPPLACPSMESKPGPLGKIAPRGDPRCLPVPTMPMGAPKFL